MDKCKTKVIQTDIGIFRHNQVYPGIIQAYSDIFKALCNPGSIFRAVVYLETLHLQKQRHVQNPALFVTLVYSEPLNIQMLPYSKSEAYSEPSEGRGGFYKMGHKYLAILKVKLKCKY